MKKEDIFEALNDVDFDMVENAYEYAEKKKSKSWLKWGALAASLLLIIGAAIAVPLFRGEPPLSDVPIWDASHFSANAFFESNRMDGRTKSYTKVYVPDSAYLPINDVPQDSYLRIYRNKYATSPTDKTELQTFADSVMPKLADILNIPRPEYSIKESQHTDSLNIISEVSPYRILIHQSTKSTRTHLSKPHGDDPLMVLDGNPVQIDQRLSDEEILASLQPVKKSLFNIFGVSFSNAKVSRDYNAYGENGAESIRIYFYEESAHYLNEVSEYPVTDYICIDFDNFDNLDGKPVSDSILKVADIDYCKYRVDQNENYKLEAQAKQLSLAEAERLLQKGYVLETGCPFCASMQEEVTFDSYDFMSLGYSYSSRSDTVLPVYAFYKKIGTAPNGNTTYAKAYVPAIEVEGYEEYFEARHKEHETQ